MDVIAYQMRCEVYSKQKETREKKHAVKGKWNNTTRKLKLNEKIALEIKREFNFRAAQTVLWLSTVNAIGFFSTSNLFFSYLRHITPKEFSFLLRSLIVVVMTLFLLFHVPIAKPNFCFLPLFCFIFWLFSPLVFLVVVVSNTPMACILQPKFV